MKITLTHQEIQEACISWLNEKKINLPKDAVVDFTDTNYDDRKVEYGYLIASVDTDL
jgi:hypothetical protein